MDHFARPDDELAEAQSRRALTRNFQGYSVRAAQDVVAFGVSAISDVGGLYSQNTHSIAHYKKRIGEGDLATERGFFCTADDIRRRGIITQLMCNFHVDLGPFAAQEFGRELTRLSGMQELVAVRGSEVEVTPLGRIFVRNIASVFDAHFEPETNRFSRAV